MGLVVVVGVGSQKKFDSVCYWVDTPVVPLLLAVVCPGWRCGGVVFVHVLEKGLSLFFLVNNQKRINVLQAMANVRLR